MPNVGTVDWSVLNLPGVEEVATKAASSVARKFDGVLERDDAKQEIYIWMATHPELVRTYVQLDQLGLLYNRLASRGFDAAEKLAGYTNRTVDIALFKDVD